MKDSIGSRDGELDLSIAHSDPYQMSEEFWQAYRALDRAALFVSTVQYLQESGTPLTLGALAKALPPTHDLEALAYWLAMAREAGLDVADSEEVIDLLDEENGWTRFHAPLVEIAYDSVKDLDPEAMG